jgi:hypothetical protein
LEASQDENGIILRIRTSGGLTVQTNGRNLVENRDRRNEARWEEALRMLEDHGLILDRRRKREVLALTDEGYRAADLLRQQSFLIPLGVPLSTCTNG